MPSFTFIGNYLLECRVFVMTQPICCQLMGLERCYKWCWLSLHIAEMNKGIYDLQKVELVHRRCVHVCTDNMDLKWYYLIYYKAPCDIWARLFCCKNMAIYVYNLSVVVTWSYEDGSICVNLFQIVIIVDNGLSWFDMCRGVADNMLPWFIICRGAAFLLHDVFRPTISCSGCFIIYSCQCLLETFAVWFLQLVFFC